VPVTSLTSKLKQLLWYQWLLAALVLIYIIYIALSYLYLPDKLKQVVESDVSDLIGRDISVERFEFNPFVLSIKVGQFSIADKPEKPLVGWHQLFANFSFWESLFTWEIAFEELVLDQPEINIEKDRDRFNFSDIIERFNTEEASPEQPAEKTRIALEIFHTAINQGVFRFTDLSGNTPAHSNLDDITIVVKDLYLATGDEHFNPFDVKATIPGGGDVQFSGQYRIDPLYVDANLVANDVQLETFSEFIENIIPMEVSNGLLSVNTKVLAKQECEFQLQVNQGQISIKSLALDDDIVDPPMLQAESINVADLTLDLLQQSVTVGSVTLEGITLNQWLDREGKPRYEHLIVKEMVEQNKQEIKRQETAQPEQKESGPPWDILVKHIDLKSSTLNFSDQNEQITVGHSLSGINLDLENVTLKSDEQVSMQLIAMLDEQGQINVDGALTLLPFSMNLNYQIEKVLLPPFSEYVETASFLRIEKGSLSVDGNVTFSAEDSMPLNAELKMVLDGFQAEDTRTGKPIIILQEFKLDNIQVDTNKRNFSIASVIIMKPEVFVEMSKDKEINLATLAKSSEEQPQASDPNKETETDDSADWAFSIGKIQLQNGTTYYTDKSVKPIFKTGLHSIALNVDQIATDSQQPTPFSLTSKIDRYAPFNIKGTLAPLDKQPGFVFISELKGLEMPGLSPYSATYIGNNLKSGKLALALDYSLQNRKLKGNNNIVAKNLYLGEEVPSEKAIDAPVALGLALLRDIDGVIDLDVGVSGDLDDPGFSVSGIVLKALVNVIVKAATSPFQLLGSLVGGREDLGDIDFAEGLAELDEDNQERLKQLVEALTQRPQLAVHIKGNAADQDDAAKLQKLRVQELVAASRKISLVELQEEAGEKDWWTVRGNRKALSKMNDELKLPTESEREVPLQAQKPQLKDDELEAEVYQQMYEDVSGKQVISTDDLLALADHRALSIKQHLVDVLQFDHQRVSVSKTNKSELNGRVIKLKIEVR
jgi:uncharacterized protein involved in outer membrane biogenesis